MLGKKFYLHLELAPGNHTILVFRTERHGDIPTGTPITDGSNPRIDRGYEWPLT